jgi:hypothetical protein
MAPFNSSYEKDPGGGGFETIEVHPEYHYSVTDEPIGGDPAGAKAAADDIQETGTKQSMAARHGAVNAVQDGVVRGDMLSFAASSGVFTSGPDVGAMFDRAVQDSGGVRQGNMWVSDAAPGVHRNTSNKAITLEDQQKISEFEPGAAHAGRTFESQRRSHWTKS